MSAPTFLCDPTELGAATVGCVITVNEQVAHHISVMRISETEPIDLVDGQGTRVSGFVTDKDQFTVESIAIEELPPVRLTVAQALIKGDRLDRAIEMLTEVGVAGIIPWEAQHSVIRWRAEKKHKGRAKWQQIVNSAVEQSRRSHAPVVSPAIDSAQLTQLAQSFDHVLLLEEIGGLPPAGTITGSVLVVVGPEGGVSESERIALGSLSQCQSVTLGSNVLRSATAGVVAVSYLNTITGQWGAR